MFNTTILNYFNGLKPPKGTHVKVDDDVIVLLSTNANPYLIGFYVVLVLITILIAIVSHSIHVVWIGLIFAALAYNNKISKATVSLKPKVLVIKEQLWSSLPYTIDITKIDKVVFKGLNVSSTAKRANIICMRLLMHSGEEMKCLSGTANQKFIYGCVKFFVENLKE